MESAYTAIGRAVFAAQRFETVLVPIFEFFKMHTEPGYLEKTGGFINTGMFKVPIQNIVKFLRERGSIAPDLEARLNSYTEARHQLIHRWFAEHGWPDENDLEGFAPIIALANQVETESNEFTQLFVGYILQHAVSSSDAPNETELKSRVAKTFQHAHLKD